jgi:hypothetical protein
LKGAAVRYRGRYCMRQLRRQRPRAAARNDEHGVVGELRQRVGAVGVGAADGFDDLAARKNEIVVRKMNMIVAACGMVIEALGDGGGLWSVSRLQTKYSSRAM